MATTVDYLGRSFDVKECPICKKQDCVEINDRYDGYNVYFYVECTNCRIQTIEHSDAQQAVNIWNGLEEKQKDNKQ